MTYAPYDSAASYKHLPEGAYARGMFLDGVPMALADRIVAQKATAKEVADFADSGYGVGRFWARSDTMGDGSPVEVGVEFAIGHCHEPIGNLLLGAWEHQPGLKEEDGDKTAGYGITVVLVAKPRGDFPDSGEGMYYGLRPQGVTMDVVDVFINYGKADGYEGWLVMPRQSGITVTSIVAGANGDLPEGLQFRTFDVPKGSYTYTKLVAFTDEHPEGIGELSWFTADAEIYMVNVEENYQRRGVATALWDRAIEMEPKLHHSSDISSDARAWRDHAGSTGKVYSKETLAVAKVDYIIDVIHNGPATVMFRAVLRGYFPNGADFPIAKLEIATQSLPGDYDQGMIRSVAVAPEYQHQGIASALLAHARANLPYPVIHTPWQTPEGKGWAEHVGAAGMWWRTQTKDRTFGVDDAKSTPFSGADKVTQPGYSCFSNPWHLYLYAWLMWPSGDHEDVVCFSGSQVGVGNDEEPLVMPDMRTVRNMTWAAFEAMLPEAPLPPSPKFASWVPPEYATWKKLADHLKYLDQGKAAQDFIVAKYATLKSTAMPVGPPPAGVRYLFTSNSRGNRKPLGTFCILGAVLDGHVIGYLTWGIQDRKVQEIWVDPQQRRRRIAETMFSVAKDFDPAITHHVDRSDAGDAWARATSPDAPVRENNTVEDHEYANKPSRTLTDRLLDADDGDVIDLTPGVMRAAADRHTARPFLTGAIAQGNEPLPMGPGIFYRVHPRGRTFSPEDARSKVHGFDDLPGDIQRIVKPMDGYSAFANPAHLRQYVEDMDWDTKDPVVRFEGRIVGEGYDAEPLVMPTTGILERIKWETFKDRIEFTRGAVEFPRWGEADHGTGQSTLASFGALETKDYDGKAGRRDHITRDQRGTVPTSAIATMGGVRGEVPGQHRNRLGEKWTAFLADIKANGITDPIFITVDPGEEPKISEGNHRRDAAVELGMDEVPVQIRYFGHAETQFDAKVGASSKTLYRGFNVELSSDDLYELSSAAIEALILKQALDGTGTNGLGSPISGQGLGVHWSTNIEVARNFSDPMARHSEPKITRVQNWGAHVPVVLTATVAEADYVTEENELEEAMVEGFGWDHGDTGSPIPEDEVLVRKHAPVHITSVEAAAPRSWKAVGTALNNMVDSAKYTCTWKRIGGGMQAVAKTADNPYAKTVGMAEINMVHLGQFTNRGVVAFMTMGDGEGGWVGFPLAVLTWEKEGNRDPWGEDPDAKEINIVYVMPDQRRHGYATKLFNFAKTLEPSLMHSGERTPNGTAWAKSFPGVTPKVHTRITVDEMQRAGGMLMARLSGFTEESLVGKARKFAKTARVSGIVPVYHGTTKVNWDRLNGGDPKAESMQALCSRIESDFGLAEGRIWNSSYITWPRSRAKKGNTNDFYCTLDKDVAEGYAVAGTAPLYDFLMVAFTAAKVGARFKGFFGPDWGKFDETGKAVRDNGKFFDSWMKEQVLKYGGGAIVLTFEVPTAEFGSMFNEARDFVRRNYMMYSIEQKREDPNVPLEEIEQWAADRAREGGTNDAELTAYDYEVKALRKYLQRITPIAQPDHITTRSTKTAKITKSAQTKISPEDLIRLGAKEASQTDGPPKGVIPKTVGCFHVTTRRNAEAVKANGLTPSHDELHLWLDLADAADYTDAFGTKDKDGNYKDPDFAPVIFYVYVEKGTPYWEGVNGARHIIIRQGIAKAVEIPQWMVPPSRRAHGMLAQAAAFTMPTHWYHGASQRRAEESANTGFPVDYSPKRAIYGKGLYLTNLYSDAEGFAGRVSGGRQGAVIEIDPMFTNAFVSTIDPMWDVGKAYPGENGKPDEILKRHGHDGIIIALSSRCWAVVFNPSQVKYVTHDVTPMQTAAAFSATEIYTKETHVREVAQKMGPRPATALTQKVLTDAGFPQGDQAEAQEHPQGYGHSSVAWMMDANPPVPVVALGGGMWDELTILHECAHIIRNGPAYAGKQGGPEAHDAEFMLRYAALVKAYGTPAMARRFSVIFGDGKGGLDQTWAAATIPPGALTFVVNGTKEDEYIRIDALVSDLQVGFLIFNTSGGEIRVVNVWPGHQRQGIATAMLAYARTINPDVHHSSVLSTDGEAWANNTASVHAVVQMPIDEVLSSFSSEYDSVVSGIEANLRQMDRDEGRPEFLDQLVAKIKKRGFTGAIDLLAPPVGEEADGNTLADGHHRAIAAKLAGLTSVPVRIHLPVEMDYGPEWPTYHHENRDKHTSSIQHLGSGMKFWHVTDHSSFVIDPTYAAKGAAEAGADFRHIPGLWVTPNPELWHWLWRESGAVFAAEIDVSALSGNEIHRQGADGDNRDQWWISPQGAAKAKVVRVVPIKTAETEARREGFGFALLAHDAMEPNRICIIDHKQGWGTPMALCGGVTDGAAPIAWTTAKDVATGAWGRDPNFCDICLAKIRKIAKTGARS